MIGDEEENSLPRRVINLQGQRFERLVVTSFAGLNKHKTATWNAICDCGNRVVASANHLRFGNTKSCGCLNDDTRRKMCIDRSTTHGMSKTKEYQTWCNMIARTTNENRPDYRFYGGKGIKVCQRWRESFDAFLSDMGSCPDGMTLDRVDPLGNYEPSNCRWATWEVQHQNTTSVRRFSVFGKEMTLKEMSEQYGIKDKCLYQRIHKLGLSPEAAVSHKYRGRIKNGS